MLIDERGYMNIDELASLLEVSTQTVRRDIRKLSEQGLITRHHGGAGRRPSDYARGSGGSLDARESHCGNRG